MSFNYTPLWKQLKKSGLSKTDLRLKTGISTSTLAKLSAGDAVSMDVLKKIATVLGCTLDNIVSMTDTRLATQWSTLKPNHTYTVRMIFMVDEDLSYYITGSAISFQMPQDGMDTWYISRYSDYKNYYLLEGCADSECLLQLLNNTSDAYTLDYFLKKQKININPRKIHKDIISSIKNTILCNGYAQYHPPYIMPSINYCNSFKPELAPIASPTDGIKLCEGFENTHKRSLYTDNGIVIESRQKEYLSILRNEYANSQGLSDIIHLGNFEILTNPSDTYDESAGVNVIIEKDMESNDKALNFIISLVHKKIEKIVTIEFIAYADSNPTNDIITEFDCRTEDKTWIHNEWLPCDGFEIKMWHSDHLATQSGKLLYHIKHSLITEMTISMKIVEKEYNLIDEWTEKVNKANKSELLKTVQTTNLNTQIGKSYNNTNSIIKEDFRRLFARNPLSGQSVFLEKGENKQIEFLEWLKSTISTPDISKVIIIDPYIDLKAIGACLRAAGNYNQEWEIYMDSKKNHDDIIDKKETLMLASPAHFQIYGLADKLHDRFLILLGAKKHRVFMLSNSLDSVAVNYPSAIVLIDDIVSEQIIKYYENMLGNSTKKIIFTSANETTSLLQSDTDNPTTTESIIIPDFCKKSRITTAKDAENVINVFLSKGIVILYPHKQNECISAYRCLCSKGLINNDFLTNAENYIISSVNYAPYTWKAEELYEAVCYLRDNEWNSLMNIASNIASTDYKKKLPPLTYCYISMLILYSIADISYDIIMQRADCFPWSDSELTFIHSMIVVTLIEKADISTLSQIISILPRYVRNDNECISSLIYLLKKLLHFRNCCADTVSIISQQIVSFLKKSEETDIKAFLQNILSPLYPWYAESISCIISDAYKASVIRKEEAQQILINFLLKSYKDCISYENYCHFDSSDLLQSCKYIDRIMEITPKAASIISKAMEKIERSTDQLLYNPTLKLHDYKSWKKNIDLLGCMVYLEIYLHKKYDASMNSLIINEYREICSNYENDLKKYSKIYVAASEMMQDIYNR